MPYKSDAQRRFFHTDTAKKAGITEDEVNEFDQASKGKKLPEHTKKMAEGGEVKDKTDSMSDIGTLKGLRDMLMKAQGLNHIDDDFEAHSSTDSPKNYAYGGETNAKHETLSSMENNPTAGFADGGDVPPVVTPDMPTNGGYPGAGADNLSALVNMLKTGGLSQLLPGSSATQGLAQGIGQAVTDPSTPGIINNSLGTNLQNPPPSNPAGAEDLPSGILPNAPTPGPTANTPAPSPISQAATAAQTIPPTNPGIYNGITADQRAQMLNQLLAQKGSGANLAVQGAAGLGDAITGAFGKAPTNALGNVQNIENQNIANRIGGIDTQRQQRLQDLQANLTQQENDPASPYSQGMRQFYSQLTGKTFPSGISASMMKSAFPDYAKIFDSQLSNATIQRGQVVGAQEKAATLPFFQRVSNAIFGNPAAEALQETATGGKAAPEDNGGWSVVK